MTALPAFFAAMDELLGGRLDGAGVESRIGASPSGTARLALYGELVRRQRAQLLDALFPTVARAANEAQPGLWGQIQSAYTRAHPPRHWEPNAFGAALSDFLEALAARDPSIPTFLAELADLEFLEWQVTVAPRTSTVPGNDETLHVRRYEHDLLAYRARGAAGCGTTPPAKASLTLLVCRTHTTDETFLLHPSPAALVAIARRAGHPVPAGAPPLEVVDEAERQLVAWGVLLAS